MAAISFCAAGEKEIFRLFSRRVYPARLSAWSPIRSMLPEMVKKLLTTADAFSLVS